MTDSTPLLDTVRAFAFPRFPGGAAEGRAADEVARRLEATGLEVTVEPFVACREVVPRMRRRVHFTVGAVAVLQGIVGAVAPAGAAVLGIALLAFVGRAGRWAAGLEKEFDREPTIASRNVIASRPAPPGPGAGSGATPVTVVVLAHIDSKSARYPTAVPVSFILAAAAIILAVTSWGIVETLRGNPAGMVAGWPAGPLGVLLPAGGILAATLLAFAQHNPSGDESPGAMDNASGLAVLLESARTLPGDPALSDVGLVFLATGAEEIGLAGAVRWISAHAAELDPGRTVFVNVDSVGVGHGLLALDVGGCAPDGRPMREVVRAAGRAAGVRVRHIPFLPGVGVDTMPIAVRGFPTVSLLGEVLGAPGRRIHTRRDTADHLHEDAMVAAVAVVRQIGVEVAREPREA